MKKLITYIGIVSIICAIALPTSAASKAKAQKKISHPNHIAVIKSRYDKVDTALDNFRIPYDTLEFRDLEKPDIVNRYRAIFIPSGIDTPLEESIDIFANNFRYKYVSLKPDFYEVDKKKVAKTIRQYVKGGGAAYFSGYSFEYLQQAFNIFEFFDNFPYMGLATRVEANLVNDLSCFSMKNIMALYLNHPGWITIKSARDSRILAYGTFDTPRGPRTGPVSILARRGGGQILYTSYDSTVFSAFRRFNIYRIAGAHLIEQLESKARKWNQRIVVEFADSILTNEYVGMHRIDLAEGTNTVYISSEHDLFQIDIIDKNLSLIESRDLSMRDQIFSLESQSPDYCYIKLYPSKSTRNGIYAVVSATGMRIFPYFHQSLIAVLAALALSIAVLLYRLYLSKGYSGGWKKYLKK